MTCKNCETVLAEDSMYCNKCGGKVIHNRLTLKNLFNQFSENFLNYDNKIFQTFITLFKKPEAVIDSYIGGVRKRYSDVVPYFAVALTLTGIQLFVLEKFFPGLYDLSSISRPETEKFNEGLMEFISDFQSLIMMLYIPLYAIMARMVFFNKKKYNFTELLVVFLYLQSQISIASFFLTLIAGISNLSFEVYTYAILLPLQIIYFIYSLRRLYKLSIFDMIVRTILFCVVLGVFFFILIIIISIIMYLNGDLQQMIEVQRQAREAKDASSI